MIDVSPAAGFPLQFDPDSLKIKTASTFAFREQSRTVEAMSPVLDEPSVDDPGAEAYRTYLPERFPEPVSSAFAEHLITYSLVAVPPRRLGLEAAKTFGHIHGPLPGTTLTTPEVYAQIHGRLVVMLQQHDPSDMDRVHEFVAIELSAGEAILIPPGWAHGLANPFEETGLLAGLYAVPDRFPADYSPMEKRRGMAGRVVPTSGGFELRVNPAYRDVPVRRLADPIDSPFEAEQRWSPLWSAAAADPASFRFLSDASEAEARFGASEGAR